MRRVYVIDINSKPGEYLFRVPRFLAPLATRIANRVLYSPAVDWQTEEAYVDDIRHDLYLMGWEITA